MNNFAQMLPDTNQMDRPQLTDEELMRLAQMLQAQGEGLASINPSEAQMLKDAGGSGRPIPGTQGYGVGGGPIRTYTELTDVTYEDLKKSGLAEAQGSELGGGTDSTKERNFGPTIDGRYFSTAAEMIAHNKKVRKQRADDVRPDNKLSEDRKQIWDKKSKTWMDAHTDAFGGKHKTKEAADAVLVFTDAFGGKHRTKEARDAVKVFRDTSGKAYRTAEEAEVHVVRDKYGNPHGTEAEAERANRQADPSLSIGASAFSSGPELGTEVPAGFMRIMTEEGPKLIPIPEETPPEGLPEMTPTPPEEQPTVEGPTAGFPAGTEQGEVRIGQYGDKFSWDTVRGWIPAGNVFDDKTNVVDIGEIEPPPVVEQPPVITGPETFNRPNEVVMIGDVMVTKVYANDGTGKYTIINSEGDINLSNAVDQNMDHSISISDQGTDLISNEQVVSAITDTKTEGVDTSVVTETVADTETETETETEDTGESDARKLLRLELEDWINTKFTNKTFTSGGVRTVQEDGSVVEETPTTYEAFKTKLLAEKPNHFKDLSELQIREIYDKAMKAATREERLTLTAGDIQQFVRPAVTMEGVSDATAPQITTVPTATAPGVDAVGEATKTVISFVPDVESEYLTNLRADENELIDLLQKRIAGEAPSPAELQHKRQTEENLKMLFATTRGGPADPARVRQVQNLWRDIQQVATGQAAEMRSAEQIAAENTLAETLKAKGTREASLALGKMEAEKDVALKNGDIESARKISIMQAKLTRSVAKAKIETDVVMANLEAKKQILIQNNQSELATVLANLQKEIIISETNAELALQARSLDDALSKIAFQGEMAMEELEVQIDLAEMDAKLRTELTKLGIDSQEKMNKLDNDTKIVLGKIQKAWEKAKGNSQKESAIIGGLSLIISKIVTSDRRAKKKIKSGKSEAQQFLDSLKAYSYEYKDPDSVGAKAGRILSVMAQDLEKTDLGQQMVIATPAGKFVDYGQSLAAILASQAHLNDELKSISARI